MPLACPIVPLYVPHTAAVSGQERATSDRSGYSVPPAFRLVRAPLVLVRRARDSNPRGRVGYRPHGFQDLSRMRAAVQQ